MDCVVGVDLGGTNVRAMVVRADGTPVGPRIVMPSRAREGVEATAEAVACAVQAAVEGSSPGRLGLAVPGHIDDAAGLVRWAPNFGSTVSGRFVYWRDVPLRAELERRLSLPVTMGNDANLAALGEYRFGVGGDSARCLVLLTLGTGVGFGVVLSPEAVHGTARGPLVLLGGNKGGAEGGHIVIQRGGVLSSAGAYGSLEGYCSAGPIVDRAAAKLLRGRASSLTAGTVTCEALALAADEGDEVAREVWREVGEVLGVAIGSFVNLFAPDVVAVGGQISGAGRWLLEPTREAAREVAIPSLFSDARIVPAERVEDAGILGAAALAFGVEGAP